MLPKIRDTKAKPRGKPFEKGDQRIWRKGRGQGTMMISDLLCRQGAINCPEALTERIKKAFGIKGHVSLVEAVHWGTWIEALKGEQWAVQYIADRTEGKAKQSVELSAVVPGITFRDPNPDEIEA